MKIEKAVRKKTRLLACLFGFTGGGKTMSALKLAKGIGIKIGLIDTEGRATLHDKKIEGGFDIIDLKPPYSPENIIKAIEKFEEENYDVIIIDSISHEWNGIGGCIDIAEKQLTKYKKEMKGLCKWNIPKSRHNKLMTKILYKCNTHLIFCARAKHLYKQAKGGVVTNEGIGLRQESEFGNEMIITFYMNKGKGIITKGEDELVENLNIKEFQHLTENHGKIIKKWLDSGVENKFNPERLKESMLEVAELGTLQLNLWWENLSKEKKVSLKKFPENITKAKELALKFDNQGSKTSGLEERNE